MAFPKWVKEFYIYYLSEYLPPMLKMNLREIREIENQIMKTENHQFKTFLSIKRGLLSPIWLYMFDIYIPIQDGTLWKGTPKRINRFNSYSYRPYKMGPKRNLTTWLFGTPGKHQYGKFYQLLRDRYKPMIREKSKTITFDFKDDFNEDHEESLGFEDRIKVLKSKDVLQDENVNVKRIIDKIIKGLINLGISERDIKIYIRWKKDGITQSAIAQENGLSTRQIKRICQKVKKIIPKLRHLIPKE